jgi:hypothetical protein
MLTARSKDIVWISGHVVDILQEGGIIALSPLQGNIGLEIHVVSLGFLSIMLWVRFYYSERSVRIQIHIKINQKNILCPNHSIGESL